jgi:hypothetical protein
MYYVFEVSNLKSNQINGAQGMVGKNTEAIAFLRQEAMQEVRRLKKNLIDLNGTML